MFTNPISTRVRKGGLHFAAALLASVLMGDCVTPAFATIENSVVAAGTAKGAPVTATAVEQVDVVDQVSTLTLDKSALLNDANNNGSADVGETITYTFRATNTGNVTLTNVVLSDDKVTASPLRLRAGGDVAPLGDSADVAGAGWASLAPGDTVTATATHTLSAVDFAAGQVVNVANLTAVTVPGQPVTATDTVTTPLSSESGIALEKSGTLDLVDAVADVGDIITYQFSVTNTGPTPLTNVSVADPKLQVASLPNAGRLQNLVAMAETPADPIITASVTPTAVSIAAREPDAWRQNVPVVPAALHATRRLIQLGGDDATFTAGNRIGVYFRLTNTGDAPLTAIEVTQPGSDAFGSTLDILAPNTTDSSSVLFTHVLTEEDVATGQVDLVSGITARARGTLLTQTLSGSLSLLDVETGEDIATASITPASVALLAPGATTTFAATYELTQADIDAGQVFNTATAVATNVLNDAITATDEATVAVPQAPAIAVEKDGVLAFGEDGKAGVGDLITYTFSLTNIGNTTLNDVELLDPLPNLNLTFASFDGFEPGDTRDFTGTYVLTQEDIDAGKVENQATVSGVPALGGNRVTGRSDDPKTTTPDDETVTAIPAAPAVALVKNAPTLNDINTNGMADVGDSLTWTFAVHNTGNVRLTNVTVTDDNTAVTVTPASPTNVTIEAGAVDTTSFTATYILTEADLLARRIENNAAVTADAPDGTTADDGSHPSSITEDGPTVYDIPPNPAVAILKPQPVVLDSNGNGMNDAGDAVNYTVRVVNTGNVTLTNVVITDPKASNFTFTVPTLLPGEVNAQNVPVAYAITADDMRAGRIENIAFVETVFEGETIGDQSDPDNVTEDDPTITAIIARPAIALVKPQPDITDVDANGVTNEGDQLVYTFAVTNTGNVDLSNITITDTLGSVVSTRTTVLAPGDTDDTSFTLTYTLTAADITRGSVTNTAFAIGLSPTNVPARDTSDDDSILQDDPTVTPLANLIDPSIALLKQATTQDVNANGVVDVGDRITYTFSVTNTGNVNLTNVQVSDAKLAAEGILLQPGNGLIGNLARGATSAVLSASRTIVQADVDAGAYDNQATVEGFFGSRTVTDLSDDDSLTGNDRTVVPMARNPAIAIIKPAPANTDRNGNGVIDAGDLLTYSFEVHNTGNVTLYNVAITDNNADEVQGGPLVSLAPGAVDRTTFTATRVVQDLDALAGSIENSATVRAAQINGGVLTISDISDVGSLAGRLPTVTPIVMLSPSLSKTAARSAVRRGERVEYTITAGSLGLGPYDVADLMPPGFAFVPGSASVNGVAAVPAQSGKTLTFANITPTTARKITVKLSLRASASTSMATGEFVNRARLYLNSNGVQLAEASARVTIKEEAIFDCGEIIGRVFDDVNNNGYMDEGETGMPGVRVVTVKGLLITTDAHGRFHVTCADVPNALIGSNFLMKLDTRTLPTGYALTTENPRDVRLTRGKVTKLNFGVSKRRDVGLDLTKDAFDGDLDLRPKFATGIDRLVSLLRQGKGQLTITYRCGAYAPIADERLIAVTELVQTKWKQEGGNKPLKITTRVECGK